MRSRRRYGDEVDLQVWQDESFQNWEWRFNRFGWVVITVFVLAGLAGLLGPGPFSWARTGGDAGLIAVQHQRVGHLEADDAVTVTVSPEAVTQDSIRVVLSPEWIQAVDIDGIRPTPDSETSTPDGLALEFAVEPAAELDVQITYRASELGRIHGSAAIDGDAVTFTQLILP